MRRAKEATPSWLGEANRRLREVGLGSTANRTDGPPRVGELRVAEPVEQGTAAAGIVCVVDVDPVLAAARAALVSNETDLATAADLIAPGASTGLPFDLMVETDVIGTLWWSQLVRRVGQLAPRLTARLRDAAAHGVEGVPEHLRGVPVVSAGDPRQDFKGEESVRMAALSTDCETAVAGGASGLPLMVDPALVAAQSTDDASRYAARLTAVVVAVADADRPVVPAGAAALLLEAWDRGLRPPPDAWRGLQPLLERALVGQAPGAKTSVDFRPSRRHRLRSADRALADACAEQGRRGVSAVRLLTARDAWFTGRAHGTNPAAVRLAGGSRLWLIRQHLEVRP